MVNETNKEANAQAAVQVPQGLVYPARRYLEDVLAAGSVTEQVVARTALRLLAAPQPQQLNLPPMTCPRSNRSDCALFGVSTNRPSRALPATQQGEQENSNG